MSSPSPKTYFEKEGAGSVWFLSQISQMNAENISAKISAISGKQTPSDSIRSEIEPVPKGANNFRSHFIFEAISFIL